jgi:hypothetical protein
LDLDLPKQVENGFVSMGCRLSRFGFQQGNFNVHHGREKRERDGVRDEL